MTPALWCRPDAAIPAGTPRSGFTFGISWRAAEDRAADAVVARLDEMVEAEPDAAVLADPDGRDGVVRLRALEAVHRDASSRADR